MRFLAFMNIGPLELIFVLLIILLLFGAKKLPELARGLRQAVKEFQKGSNEFNDGLHKTGTSGAETAKSDGKPAQSTVSQAENKPTGALPPDLNPSTIPANKADQV